MKIGRDNNTRWGQKVEAICNHPDCDATVNLYVEGSVVRRGKIESSGAMDVIEEFEDEFPKPLKINCESCGTPSISEVNMENSHRHPGVELTYKANCGCKPLQSIVRHTAADLEDPSELQEKLEAEDFVEKSGDSN